MFSFYSLPMLSKFWNSGLSLVLVLGVGTAVCQAEAPAARVVSGVAYREPSSPADAYAAEKCQLDLYVPAQAGGFPTIVWFHGGGLTQGKRSIPNALKNHGVAIAAASYRLSPKVDVRTCLDDAAAAVAWVRKHIAEYGGNPDQVIISGHSAGGFLSAMLALDPTYLGKYGLRSDDFLGVAPFSTQTITHFTARAEENFPVMQPVINELSPLFHVQNPCPPMLLITGDRELEMVGRYEENAYLWRMLKLTGHTDVTLYELDGYNHGGMAEPGFPLLLKFVQRLVKSSHPAAAPGADR
jgi:acetyl esterase/lipase